MKKIVLLTSILLGFNCISQEFDSIRQYSFIKSVKKIKWKYFNVIIDSCNKYDLSKFSKSNQAEIQYLKAKATVNKILLEDSTYTSDHWSNNPMDLFDSSISISKGFYKEKYTYHKYYAKYRMYQNANEELQYIKNKGFVEDKANLVVTPEYNLGQHSWVGVNLSLNYLQKRYKVPKIDSTIMGGGSILEIGYKNNLNTNNWKLSLSLISYAKRNIELNITKFNLNRGEPNFWSYSPELGFRFGYLHLFGGYDIPLKKGVVSFEKYYFGLKYDISLFEFKE